MRLRLTWLEAIDAKSCLDPFSRIDSIESTNTTPYRVAVFGETATGGGYVRLVPASYCAGELGVEITR